ncbi:MAG: hypothetical protein AB8B72_01665 [Crocinitomicaceae bacterium]
MSTLYKIFLVIFVLTSVELTAQVVNLKGSFFVDVTIPTNERNKAFNQTMEGLFNGAVGYQHNVFKGLTLGVGAKYSYFVSDRVAFSGAIGTGGTHIPGGFVKIGYEKYTTDRVSLYGGIKTGYANVMVVNDSCQALLGGPFQKGSLFIEPQLEINILTELRSASAFNMIVSYAINFQEFTPDYLCRSDIPGLVDSFGEGYIRYLSIGFGFKHYFGKN